MTERTRKLSLTNAVTRIRRRGALLVFPIDNRELPPSLWAEFHPNTKMRWKWDDDGDNRVHEMWHMMKRLSDCREVVYSKWYQGRATFFSRELFTAMLAVRRSRSDHRHGLSQTARTLLDVLENNSPLSTRTLKVETDLQGRFNEAAYTRAMKELFTRLLIVAFGEVEDGAFPSLAVGATELLFEDLWIEAATMPLAEAHTRIEHLMPPAALFRRYFDKTISS